MKGFRRNTVAHLIKYKRNFPKRDEKYCDVLYADADFTAVPGTEPLSPWKSAPIVRKRGGGMWEQPEGQRNCKNQLLMLTLLYSGAEIINCICLVT